MPKDYDGMAEYLLGNRGYVELETIDKEERQRQWDAMRASAWTRYQEGSMPAWFNPNWLMQEEAPMNRMLRLDGNEVYQADDTWLGGGGDAGGGKHGGDGGGGGWRWWREEDPYWPLRSWGDHPMRWWTFAFAAVLALGGVTSYVAHGAAESLWVGSLSAAALSTCAMAMSDVTDWGHGALAVKAAWIVSAALACKELALGWSHRPAPSAHAHTTWLGGKQANPAMDRWGGCGRACVLMCACYMWTGMAGLDEWALPANPGAVYKNPDVSIKHRVWNKWGFGNAAMRT